MNVVVTDRGTWINGKRVWPRKRRSWLAVLRRWRRRCPNVCLWCSKRPVIVQIMTDSDDGTVMVQRVASGTSATVRQPLN